ncbi:hypothetical protein GRAQ_03373 [Rahnella aquatilis CIP 78.65 = ATCC 33071]|nr:hypothetical protein GRAQ_03373 [Rahnella aquatilis CIP 78.65 = ATCC 33071]
MLVLAVGSAAKQPVVRKEIIQEFISWGLTASGGTAALWFLH